ncbi:Inositolphosphorylceramide synthase subunit Kei1-domain-containing protein [Flagelloscypha sp. PMI_526]|nr:Inositolphosphorylceramide synthase subunit Kei1-domain-containing protein [Flagelloscypha sp. PMI_526]
MKLTLRPEWRLWPLSSFLGFLDIKTGVTIALLFAIVNKVAGIYGLLALLFGSGASFAQLSLYIYSTIALVALAWGLKAVKSEDPKHTLYFAHLFFFDHILSSSWTLFFAVLWWVYTPHDGRRMANSAAQEELIRVSPGSTSLQMTDDERASAAYAIWNKEKNTAMSVIIASWSCKIYFAMLLYSYAVHLRKGSYRKLPLTSKLQSGLQTNGHLPSHYVENSALAPHDDEEEQGDDFYRVPVRSPITPGRKSHTSHRTQSSFAEFVSAGSKGSAKEHWSEDDDVIFDAASSSRSSHDRAESSGTGSP